MFLLFALLLKEINQQDREIEILGVGISSVEDNQALGSSLIDDNQPSAQDQNLPSQKHDDAGQQSSFNNGNDDNKQDNAQSSLIGKNEDQDIALSSLNNGNDDNNQDHGQSSLDNGDNNNDQAQSSVNNENGQDAQSSVGNGDKNEVDSSVHGDKDQITSNSVDIPSKIDNVATSMINGGDTQDTTSPETQEPEKTKVVCITNDVGFEIFSQHSIICDEEYTPDDIGDEYNSFLWSNYKECEIYLYSANDVPIMSIDVDDGAKDIKAKITDIGQKKSNVFFRLTQRFMGTISLENLIVAVQFDLFVDYSITLNNCRIFNELSKIEIGKTAIRATQYSIVSSNSLKESNQGILYATNIEIPNNNVFDPLVIINGISGQSGQDKAEVGIKVVAEKPNTKVSIEGDWSNVAKAPVTFTAKDEESKQMEININDKETEGKFDFSVVSPTINIKATPSNPSEPTMKTIIIIVVCVVVIVLVVIVVIVVCCKTRSKKKAGSSSSSSVQSDV